MAAMDARLMENNRKLLLGLQKEISDKVKRGLPEAKDVKSLTGALKDIEAVANPRPEINITNQANANAQNLNRIEVVFVEG